MSFTVTAEGGDQATVAISGELDIDSVEALARAAADVLSPPPRRLVVELRDLRFADSSAIALFVRWATIVGQIELRNASPLLTRVITTMGLAQKLGLQPT